MISPLDIATDGYLNCSLSIATNGYLHCPDEDKGIFSGIQAPGLKEQIEREDDEMMMIIMAFMETRH